MINKMARMTNILTTLLLKYCAEIQVLKICTCPKKLTVYIGSNKTLQLIFNKHGTIAAVEILQGSVLESALKK